MSAPRQNTARMTLRADKRIFRRLADLQERCGAASPNSLAARLVDIAIAWVNDPRDRPEVPAALADLRARIGHKTRSADLAAAVIEATDRLEKLSEAFLNRSKRAGSPNKRDAASRRRRA
jgi:hypothetical protein